MGAAWGRRKGGEADRPGRGVKGRGKQATATTEERMWVVGWGLAAGDPTGKGKGKDRQGEGGRVCPHRCCRYAIAVADAFLCGGC